MFELVLWSKQSDLNYLALCFGKMLVSPRHYSDRLLVEDVVLVEATLVVEETRLIFLDWIPHQTLVLQVQTQSGRRDVYRASVAREVAVGLQRALLSKLPDSVDLCLLPVRQATATYVWPECFEIVRRKPGLPYRV